MTSSKEQEQKKPDHLERPGRLELKKTVETGQIRQSFSHGRSRTVTVEVKRKRTYAATESGQMREVMAERELVAPEIVAEAAVEALPRPQAADTATQVRRPATLRALTSEEKEARARALHDARIEAAESKRRGEIDAQRAIEEEHLTRVTEEEEARRLAVEDEERQRVEGEAARSLAEEEAARLAKAAEAAVPAPAKIAPVAELEDEGDEEAAERARRGRAAPPRHPAPK
ncbi:MAG: IF-2-associated domain-containing protein, partial [Alphaproteobacteria bacterium]